MRRLIYLIILIIYIMGVDSCVRAGSPPFHYIMHEGGATVKVIPIWVDKEFSEGDKLAIDDAIMQWNVAMNGYVKLLVIGMNYDTKGEVATGWIITKIGADEARDRGKLVLAFVNEIGGNRIYFIRERISEEWMMGVALHEIGHLMGAYHDEIYLMQPHYDWESYRCIDGRTVAQVGKYWGLPINRLNYCVYGTESKRSSIEH